MKADAILDSSRGGRFGAGRSALRFAGKQLFAFAKSRPIPRDESGIIEVMMAQQRNLPVAAWRTMARQTQQTAQGATLAKRRNTDAQWQPFLTQAVADALARGVPCYDLTKNKHWRP